MRVMTLAVPLALIASVALTGCTSQPSAPRAEPMAEEDVARYWLDITCPVQNLVGTVSADTIDEIHDAAAEIEREAGEAAQLLRDPGAAWPEDIQADIEVASEYYAELSEAFADAGETSTLSEYQDTVAPRVQELLQMQDESYLDAFLAIFDRAGLGSTPSTACG